jgi:hypothetical protein
LPKKERSEYLDLRRRYEPRSIKLVIIAESPPASGLYFYNPTGRVTEPLFAALMKQLRLRPKSKDEGLRALQENGWVLVDATYEPVNGAGSGRDTVIERDYALLRDDLAALTPDRSTPLILVKSNVCRILEPKLVADGFNVLNRGQTVCFPSHGWQPMFAKQFSAIRGS